MTEDVLIRALSEDELQEAFAGLGIRRGGVLFVQSSLRNLGHPRGGAHTVVRALRRALGPHGTLVVYTATHENSTTSRLHLDRIRHLTIPQAGMFWQEMPAFDAQHTPASSTLGYLSEVVRTLPGALRSAHPQTSFAALGPAARRIIEGHALTSHLGEESPLARLYELDAQTLLIGCPLSVATTLHLADYRVGRLPRQMYSCKIYGPDGNPRWLSFADVALDDTHFPAVIGRIVPRLRTLVQGRVGAADCLLVGVRELVDEAVRAQL